jgi:type IV secretory pathway VirB4 component
MAVTSSATQKFVPIRDIKDGVVIMKDGQMAMVLLATSINFALKSTDEQRAILRQFQAFLNTLDFSLQFYVQSRRLNIQPYLEVLQAREPAQDNDLMKIQLREYMEFVRSFASEVDIMTKNFFIVIPYTPLGIDLTEGLSGGISKILKRKQEVMSASKFEEEKTQLDQRVSVVEQGMARIGIRTVPLGNEELVELYYHIFNPDEINSKPPEQSV